MKYLEVEGVGKSETEGRRRRAARQGEEDQSPIQCVLPFWSSSLRLDLRPLVIVFRWFLILVYWVRFFSLRYVSFFLSTSISVWLHCPLVSDFSILGFGLFVCLFFFFFLENSWICYRM